MFTNRWRLFLLIEDAAAAVAWAFRNIAGYGGSTDWLFLSGHSAGGYWAAMVGLDKRWHAAQDIGGQLEEFQRKHRTGRDRLIFTEMVDATGLQQRLGRAFHVQELSSQ